MNIFKEIWEENREDIKSFLSIALWIACVAAFCIFMGFLGRIF